MSSGFGCEAGKLARVENSFTRFLTVSTAPVIASAQVRTTSDEAGSAPERSRWRRMRSAESAIGVSGFLISCATRLATSRQAVCFCARNRSERSSNTNTYPTRCTLCRSVATVTAAFSFVRCSAISICVVVVFMRSARRNNGSSSSRTSVGNRSVSAAPIRTCDARKGSSEGRNIRSSAWFTWVTRRSALSERTPVGMLSRMVSMCRRRCSSSMFAAPSSALAVSICRRLAASSDAI